jgi:hydroxymethylbilane synthase
MGLLAEISEFLDPSATMIPAVAQGIIGIEIRADDAATAVLLAALDDPDARVAATAERAFLARIGGGCQVPLGAYARINGNQITLDAMIGALDGRSVRGTRYGSTSDPATLGRELAEALLDDGGRRLLE